MDVTPAAAELPPDPEFLAVLAAAATAALGRRARVIRVRPADLPADLRASENKTDQEPGR
jgi:hypothetical protein